MPQEQKIFSARVEEVFSGDDLVLMVDLGIDELHKKKRVRLQGVDTPSAISEGPDTEAGRIRAFVRSLVRGQQVTLTVTSKSNNSWVGVITGETDGGPFNLNQLLIDQGYQFKR